MLALTDAATITIAVVVLFLALAFVAVIRVLRGQLPRWRRIRLGFFLERDTQEDDRRTDLDDTLH